MVYLQQHFYDVLGATYQVKHQDAVDDEVNALSPVLNSLAEALTGPYSREHLSKLFRLVANEHGSLIRSSFVLTDSHGFIDYVQNDCNPYYDGDRHTCYPPANDVDHNQKMGFAQLLRVGSDTRITQPVLSLNSELLTDNDSEVKAHLISAIEKLYRLTTHDWLHHYTMLVVGNDQIVKTNRNAALKEPLSAWNKAMAEPVAAYKQNAYEAWAVVTHAGLVARSLELSNAVNDAVNDVVDAIDLLAFDIKQEQGGVDKAAAYKELAYLSYQACTSLRYLAHPNDPVFTPFLACFETMVNSDEPEVGDAIKEIWAFNGAGYMPQQQDFIETLIKTNSVTSLFEATPSAQGFVGKAQVQTQDLFQIMSDHYHL